MCLGDCMCACVFFFLYCLFCVACLPYWRINVLIIGWRYRTCDGAVPPGCCGLEPLLVGYVKKANFDGLHTLLAVANTVRFE